MAQCDNPVIAARRLKVDKLRAEGLTQVLIAKKLKVTRRTIVRDMAVLDLELEIEPQYTETRLKIREELMGRLGKQFEAILKDMEVIRSGGSERVEEDEQAPKQDAKDIKDEREMLEMIKGNRRIKKFTVKIFGPNWIALAAHHKEYRELILLAAKMCGLLVDKETETVSEEIIEERGVVRLPIKANPEEWQEEADAYAKGDITIAIDKREVQDAEKGSGSKERGLPEVGK